MRTPLQVLTSKFGENQTYYFLLQYVNILFDGYKIIRDLFSLGFRGFSNTYYVKPHQAKHNFIILEKYDEWWTLEPFISIQMKMATVPMFNLLYCNAHTSVSITVFPLSLGKPNSLGYWTRRLEDKTGFAFPKLRV